MAPSTAKVKEIQKEDHFSAVVVVDSFDDKLRILTNETPKALLPLVNCPILEYVLEVLHCSGVHEVLLFCSSHVNRIKEYLRDTKWTSDSAKMKLTFVVSETCMSVGDALRDIYDKRLVRDDFVLLSADLVSNVNLKPILELHKKRRKVDKTAMMTLLFKRSAPGRNVFLAEPKTVLAYDENTNRILHHQIVSESRKISVPLSVFEEHSNVTVCQDILDCNVCVCSPDVLSLFSDNYDYQTRNDFIKGIVEQDEVLNNSIYLHFIDAEYAASVSNFLSYKAISHDIINRWVFPIVSDLFASKSQNICTHQRYNVYRAKDVTVSRSCRLERDVVIGHGTKIGDKTVISRSVIGQNCTIGDNVVLRDAFVWDGVTIEDCCVVDTAILANASVLKRDTKVSNSVVSYGVEVGPSVSLVNTTLSSQTDDDGADFSDDERGSSDVHQESDSEGETEDKKNLWCPSSAIADVYYDSSVAGSDDEEYGDRESPHLDDTKLFYGEVLDTLVRGIEEKLKCDNLVLEINGLKYAYNVTITEVNVYLTKAILEIPKRQGKDVMDSTKLFSSIKELLTNFLGLLKNYMKSVESQTDLLNAIKEYTIANDYFFPILMKVVHFLYESDVLQEETIFDWFDNLDSSEKTVQEKLSPFIKWLQEAEEEESD